MGQDLTGTEAGAGAGAGTGRPEAGKAEGLGAQFEQLLGQMQALRQPGGCSWTGAQNHRSIMHYLLEETYEVLEALEGEGGVDLPLLKEELGDLLLNLIFHATLAAEVPADQGGFSMQDVIQGLSEKLIRRNPHVFGPQSPAGQQLSAEAIAEAWTELKKAEKPERKSPFDGLPKALPALALAAKVDERAQAAGLDPTALGTAGLEPAGLESTGPDPDLGAWETEQELGAYLLRLVSAARLRGMDPERALRVYLQALMTS